MTKEKMKMVPLRPAIMQCDKLKMALETSGSQVMPLKLTVICNQEMMNLK